MDAAVHKDGAPGAAPHIIPRRRANHITLAKHPHARKRGAVPFRRWKTSGRTLCGLACFAPAANRAPVAAPSCRCPFSSLAAAAAAGDRLGGGFVPTAPSRAYSAWPPCPAERAGAACPTPTRSFPSSQPTSQHLDTHCGGRRTELAAGGEHLQRWRVAPPAPRRIRSHVAPAGRLSCSRVAVHPCCGQAFVRPRRSPVSAVPSSLVASDSKSQRVEGKREPTKRKKEKKKRKKKRNPERKKNK